MLLLWLLLVSSASQHMWFKKVGTNALFYEVNIDSFEPDPNYDRTAIFLKSLRVTRKSRNNYVLSGEVELLQNWGNENVVHWELTNSRGMRIMQQSQPFCEMFNSNSWYIVKARKSSTAPPGNYCPVPKGKYDIVNFKVQEEDLPLIMLKDTYTSHVRMTAGDGHMVMAYKLQVSLI